MTVLSASVPLHKRSTHSTPAQMFRVEGIQGPISTTVFLEDSKKILSILAKQASAGFSLHDVQGSQVHTDAPLQSKNIAGAKFDWDLDDTACPQGIQGGLQGDRGCAHFKTWLDNCRRYGLANCDQQLQGIQMGRVTLAQVLAEQEALIAEIAENYHRKQAEVAAVAHESMQGVQVGDVQLPEVSAPCPQGVQGDDCVRFKLWLENCHRFGLHECVEQLQGFQSGRMTLGQIFLQQEQMIKQVVREYQQRRSYSTQSRPRDSQASASGSGATATNQVGGQGLESLSRREKLQRAIKEYGSTVLVFHITISLASLGGFYLAVSSGIDLVSILQNVGVGETILQSKLATGAGTFVVAYAVHKVFAPVRIAITLTATPFIVRYLRRIGFLKPPKQVP